MKKLLSLIILSAASLLVTAQENVSSTGDSLSTSEIDKIISDASDKVYKKNNGRLYTKKDIYLLKILDKQTGRGETMGSLEAIVEAGSACLTDFKVLGGQIHGIEEDTLSPMFPYLTRNELYRVVQSLPVMKRNLIRSMEQVYEFTRTPFARRPSKKEPLRGKVDDPNHSGRIYSHQWEDMPGVGISTVTTPGHPPIHMNFGVDGQSYTKGFHIAYAASERFNVSGEKVRNADGQDIYRINLESPRPNTAREVVGTVEIDDENRLLRYDGELLGQSLWVMKEGKRNVVRLNCQSHVEYTYRRGFMEVESSRCIITYDNHEVEILLTSLNEPKVKSKKKVKAERNLIQAIKEAGYDPNMWKEAGI